VYDESIRTKALGAKRGLGPRQLDRIDIQPDQPSTGLHAREDPARMTAAAKGAVDRELAGSRAEAAQDLLDHDRPVRGMGRCGSSQHRE
jgi:hypothetical protein